MRRGEGQKQRGRKATKRSSGSSHLALRNPSWAVSRGTSWQWWRCLSVNYQEGLKQRFHHQEKPQYQRLFMSTFRETTKDHAVLKKSDVAASEPHGVNPLIMI